MALSQDILFLVIGNLKSLLALTLAAAVELFRSLLAAVKTAVSVNILAPCSEPGMGGRVSEFL